MKALSLWSTLALLGLALAPASCVREPGGQGGARAGSQDAGQAPSPFQAVVEHVDDGDTFSVTAGGQPFRVRLSGVDAPEFDQRFGVESRNRLRTLILNRSVEIRPTGIDQYSRLLACPIIGAKNVCETMVEEGWAWHYRQYSSDARLAALEKQAREARRGLWSDPDARPPWERRAEERGGRATGRGLPRTQQPRRVSSRARGSSSPSFATTTFEISR